MMRDALMAESGGAAPVPAGRVAGAELELGVLVSAVARRKWWIFTLTLLVFAGTFFAVNSIEPRYTGEAKVLLENRDSAYTRLDRDSRSEPTIDQDAVQSQVQQIMSRDLARDVIKRIDLMDNPEFDPARRSPGRLQEMLVLLGLARSPTQTLPEDRVLDNFADRLQVYSVRNSRVIAIAFSSNDPALAARGANAVAETYLTFQERAKKDISRSAGVWLTAAIEPLRQKVAEAEAKVEAFRASSGLFVGANNTSIVAQRLTELATQLSNARSQQADLQARAGIIRNAIKAGQIFDISEIANNELVRRLIENRAALRAQIAQEDRTLLPGHPRMRELNAQLAALERQITAAAEQTARALENDARVAGARVEAISRDLDDQKARVGTANEAEVHLRALERDAKSLREQLESFLVKNNEALARNVDNAVPPDARIISRAIVPDTPTFPKKLPIIIVATLAALLLSSAVVVTRELVSGRAFAPAPARPAPAEAEPTAPAAGAEPEPALAAPSQPPAVAPEPDTALQRLLQGLVSDARAGKPAGEAVILGVCGPVRHSGVTVTAIGLARSLVHGGRCILVDVDCAAPSLHRLIAPQDAAGLFDVLEGRSPVSQAIHRDLASRAHVMPIGRIEPGLTFAERAEALCRTFVALAASYDFVVLDLGVADTAEDCFLSLADVVLLSARGDENEPRTIDAYHQLVDRGARSVSVILTPDAPSPANDSGDSAASDVA